MLSVIRSTHLILSTWTRQSTTSVSVHSASPRTFIAQDHHSDQSSPRRARDLDSIQVQCRISTTLLRSANPNSFRTDWILCLHDSLVTMLFLSTSLSGIMIIGTPSSCVKSLVATLPQQVAWRLAQMLVLHGLPHANHKHLTDLCSCHHMARHWTICSLHYPAAWISLQFTHLRRSHVVSCGPSQLGLFVHAFHHAAVLS